MAEQLSDHLLAFLFALFVGCASWPAALRLGFLVKPNSLHPTTHLIGGLEVLSTFGVFLAMTLFVAPFAALLFILIKHGGLPPTGDLASYFSAHQRSWLDTLGAFAGYAGVAIGFSWLNRNQQQAIWGLPAERKNNFYSGVLSWLVCFPISLIVGQVIWFGLYVIGYESNLEQEAVQHLKQVIQFPVLFTATLAIIVIFAPIAEEVLFRGLLQSWLAAKWGVTKGILVTSAVFSLFHFSVTQGLANIELIVSLYVLSCFLGYMYVKQRSLWASIGLHMTFNVFGVIMILFFDNK